MIAWLWLFFLWGGVDAQAGVMVTTIDNGNDDTIMVGGNSKLVALTDGRLIVGYHQWTEPDQLRMAYQKIGAGGNWTLVTADPNAYVVTGDTLDFGLVDSGSRPAASYRGDGGRLYFAFAGGSDWESPWTVVNVDLSGSNGHQSSFVELAASGGAHVVISYYSASDHNLRLAISPPGVQNLQAAWTIVTLASSGFVGKYSVLQKFSDGKTLAVAYSDETTDALRFATCTFDDQLGVSSLAAPQWQHQVVLAIDSVDFRHVAFILIADEPWIAFYASDTAYNDLRVAHNAHGALSETAWRVELVDANDQPGRSVSIAATDGGVPAVAYAGSQNTLMLGLRTAGGWKLLTLTTVGTIRRDRGTSLIFVGPTLYCSYESSDEQLLLAETTEQNLASLGVIRYLNTPAPTMGPRPGETMAPAPATMPQSGQPTSTTGSGASSPPPPSGPTPSPNVAATPGGATPPPPDSPQAGGPAPSSSLIPMLAAVVGGVCVIGLLVAAICFGLRRRAKDRHHHSSVTLQGTAAHASDYGFAAGAPTGTELGRGDGGGGRNSTARLSRRPSATRGLSRHGSRARISRHASSSGLASQPKRKSRLVAGGGSGGGLNSSSFSPTLDMKYIVDQNELTRTKKIGEGAFGVVWLGEWRSIEVAIKEVKFESLSADQLAKEKGNLMMEAKKMMNMRAHANVVTLYCVCLEPLLVVSEFCAGGSLFGWLRRSPTPAPRELHRAIVQVARGVRHLHHENIIHRDLAARNVLLDESRFKVCDFGMSRQPARASGGQPSSTSTNFGPLKWMAPEQLSQQVYGTPSDVYSYGVVCYEILSQREPWSGETAANAVHRVLSGEKLPVPLNTPAVVSELMRECFRFDAAARPTMDEVCARLDRWWKRGSKRQSSVVAGSAHSHALSPSSVYEEPLAQSHLAHLSSSNYEEPHLAPSSHMTSVYDELQVAPPTADYSLYEHPSHSQQPSRYGPAPPLTNSTHTVTSGNGSGHFYGSAPKK